MMSLNKFLVVSALLGVAFCAPMSSNCSDGCVCDTPLHLVDCSGGHLSEMPLNLPGSSEILRLDLHSNQIHILDSRGNLQAYQNLEQLDLDDNELDLIEDNVLEPLVHLKRLSVHKNKLCNVSADTFHGLKNLKEIDLSNNQIQTLKSGAFAELTILEVLNLGDNLIQTIEEGAFSGLGNLRHLILSGNLLASIPSASFSNVIQLNKLDLDRNQIVTVKASSFAMLAEMNSLNLDSNQISVFSEDAFGVNAKLMLKENSTFQVRFNPLACDCNLIWLRKHLVLLASDMSKASLVTDVRCASPTSLAQRRIIDITQEVMTCDKNADESNDHHELEDRIMIASISGFCALLFFIAIFVVYRYRKTFLENSPYNAQFLNDYQRAYQRPVTIETHRDSVKSTSKLISENGEIDIDSPQNW